MSQTKRPSDWQDSAACAGDQSDVFHASESDTKAVAQARTICQRCTQREACLTDAFEQGDEWGIRAGLTPRQRKAHLRKTDGNIPRAVADALESVPLLLRNIYHHHAQPADGGHVVWADHRQAIQVRGIAYSVPRLAWIAQYGVEPVGTVTRACGVDDCVAKGCLRDRAMRDAAVAGKRGTP